MDKIKDFKKFVESIVKIDNIRWIDSKKIHWKIPLPKTNKEFKVFTKKYYGVELSCSVVVWSDGIEYTIKERQDDYSKGELYKKWDEMFSQYDGLRVLLSALFGDLSCGGVAVSHYGQTKLHKKQRDLLINWDGKSNLLKQRQMIQEQNIYLMECFGV